MLSNLNPSWQNFLSEELEKDNFLNLVQEVDEEYQNYKEKTKNELSSVEEDFIKQIDKTSKMLKNK